MTQPVLVFGDDGSTGADAAWLWVCEQRWTGWRAEVLTAATPPIGPPPGADAATPHAWAPPSPRSAFAESDLTEIVHLRAEADPRLVLGSMTDASLMVIGPRGEGVLKALHLGSTAEHLLHHLPAPLLLARRATPVRRVLAAVDGSVHSTRAVAALATMPWLDAVEEATVLRVRAGETDADAAPDDEARIAADLLPVAGVEALVCHARGSVASTILDEARTRSADLVVLGTRGVGLLKRAVVGSTASAVARLADSAVLLAHERSE